MPAKMSPMARARCGPVRIDHAQDAQRHTETRCAVVGDLGPIGALHVGSGLEERCQPLLQVSFRRTLLLAAKPHAGDTDGLRALFMGEHGKQCPG